MTRITYLRDENEQPIVCLAFDCAKDSNTVDYQMAVLHPNDKFDRKIAISVATGRLHKTPFRIDVKFDPVADGSVFAPTLNKMQIIRRAIMQDLAERQGVPRRAAKLAQQWSPF